MKKKGIIAAALCATFLALWVMIRWLPGMPSASNGLTGAGEGSAVRQGSENGRVNNPEGAYLSAYGDLPANLKNKPVAGYLRTDQKGRLMLLPSIRSRFDYFLDGGEIEGMDKSADRLRENIARSLPPQAAKEAEALLGSYLEYKRAEAGLSKERLGLPQTRADVEKMRAVNDEKKLLRLKFFSGGAGDAFFGDEEIFDDFTLKRLALFYDPTLSSAQKTRELRKLETRMTLAMRERKIKERAYLKSDSPAH